MVEADTIYRPNQLAGLIGRNHHWVLKQIRKGRLKAKSTSGNPEEPRYLIDGSDALEFLKSLEVKR